MTGSRRWGITLPLDGSDLSQLPELTRELVDDGYTDVWTAEASASDGAVPLAVAAAVAPSAQLGTAILPAFTRGPALLAMTAATLAALAPGRFSLGLGSSSPAIVEAWNGIPFVRPYTRTRDVLRFLRAALAGERVDHRYESFEVHGFRLGTVPEVPPPLLLGALQPRMLELAAAEADGAILNWLSAEDVAQVRSVVGDSTTLVARLFVCVSEDRDTVRAYARRLAAGYLTVPAYAQQQRWLGRGEQLEQLWALWADGDRAGAAASIPDETLDQLFVHGSAEECAAHIERYVAAGIDVPVVYALDTADGPLHTARALTPARLAAGRSGS